ncbi:DUF4317 domain-containing protein [Robertmurraya sp. DFI.2.37]|uniref:DUF4317 domain-containing protein n=1 Tax=Robertmurraya sp. DFI.2.37 TaxID=3031819 RepID=UPI001244926C|nr:DUF4317 domain-containing protein [Robertmurraya sp. DFI.2.37]MDF1508491.1 DUF4317 domain-containing protein [Robertmurraya sp. DFI.2.37]
MNKNDIANIRKQFKLNNKYMHIQEIFNVYVKKETGEIYTHISQPFEMLEKEAQELFLANFKKVLTGQLDSKLFELKFQHDSIGGTQEILHEGLQSSLSEDWQQQMLRIVEKMFAVKVYEYDTVVTFIRGEYQKPTKKRDQDAETGGDDEVYSSSFIFCSFNKADQPKKTLTFDYIEREFRPNTNLDPIINLTTPLAGFMFPVFHENAADVNRILYSAGKANEPDYRFIAEVLNCEDIITAEEDKASFEIIIQKVIGDEVDTETISNVYEEITRVVQENEDSEENEEPKLDYKDIERILTVSGVEDVDAEKVEFAFKDVIEDEKHEFKATNLVPKKIKISTNVADLAINPKEMKKVKYIMFEGKKCLLLEIEEDIHLEGFKLDTITL